MKKRKMMCLLLAGMMMFGLATGCISEQEQTNPSNDRSGVSEETTDYSDSESVTVDETAILEEEGLELVDGYYRFKETRTITVEMFDRGLDAGRTDPLESYWTKWVQNEVLDKHNIKVEFYLVPRWT